MVILDCQLATPPLSLATQIWVEFDSDELTEKLTKDIGNVVEREGEPTKFTNKFASNEALNQLVHWLGFSTG